MEDRLVSTALLADVRVAAACTGEDVTAGQRGYRACSDRVLAVLDAASPPVTVCLGDVMKVIHDAIVGYAADQIAKAVTPLAKGDKP